MSRMFIKHHRSIDGKADIVVFCIIGTLIAAGFIFFILKILGHSEEHVKKVKKAKVRYEESLTWRPDQTRTEERINSDYLKNPSRKKVNYKQLTLSEKAVKLIARMKRLERLNLHQCRIEDEYLKHLTDLDLRTLDLSGASITDKSVKFILQFNNLNRLLIGDTDITDKGLEELSQNRSIKFLSLELNKNITENGVKHLANMRQLQALNLSFTKIDPSCIDEIVKLKRLKNIALEDVKLKAPQIKQLSKLKRLRFLQLKMCGLHDQELYELGKFPKLHTLIISRNSFTDKGLLSLAGSASLGGLDIRDSPNLTIEGVNRFKKEKPDCEVRYSKYSLSKYSKENLKPEMRFLHSEASDLLDKFSD